eukprot:122396_1
MNDAHHDHTCVVPPLTNELFVIGAWARIEKMFVGSDILSQQWEIVSVDSVKVSTGHKQRVVVVGEHIWILGQQQLIQVIDVKTGNNVLYDKFKTLPVVVQGTAPINVNGYIYIFGGYSVQYEDYGELDTLFMFNSNPTGPTINSTTTPTINPTSNPTCDDYDAKTPYTKPMSNPFNLKFEYNKTNAVTVDQNNGAGGYGYASNSVSKQ